MSTIRIVLADDHPVVREGLRGMLVGQPDFAVVGEADNGSEAVASAVQLQPDVILMDLRMSGMDGVTAIEEIQARRLATHILVLTTYDSDADIMRAVEAGATGYLLKDAPRQDLFRAVRAAAQGETVLAPAVASRLLGRVRAPVEETLTEREIEVLGLGRGDFVDHEGPPFACNSDQFQVAKTRVGSSACCQWTVHSCLHPIAYQRTASAEGSQYEEGGVGVV